MKCVADFSERRLVPYACDFWTAAAVATIAGAVVGAGASIYNTVKQEETNDKNITSQKEINEANIQAQKEINSENLDFQRSMTQAAWERDDTQYQRQVADLEKAGLSPLAVSGALPGSNVAASPQLQAAHQYPGRYQAPQVDVNALMQGVLGLGNLAERHQQNQFSQGLKTSELGLKTQSLQFKYDELKQKGLIADAKLQQSDEHFLKTFQLQSEIFENTRKNEDRKYALQSFCEKNNLINDTFKANYPEEYRIIPKRVYYVHDDKSMEKAHLAQNLFADEFSRYLNTVENTPGSTTDSSSEFESKSAHGGASYSDSLFGGAKGFSLSGNAGASFSHGESSSHSESKDKNQLMREGFCAWCLHNDVKLPVIIYGKGD